MKNYLKTILNEVQVCQLVSLTVMDKGIGLTLTAMDGLSVL